METHSFSRSNSALHILHEAHADAPEPSVREASTFYRPPYDSELDDAFVRTLAKYLGPLTDLRAVNDDSHSMIIVEARTFHRSQSEPMRKRRVGFLVSPEASAETVPVRRSGIMTIAGEHVDVLYVMRTADIAHRSLDALFLISRWDEHLFSHRGQLNLRRLATPEARDVMVSSTAEDVQVSYPNRSGAFSLLLTDDVAVPMDLQIRRIRYPRSADMPSDAPPQSPSPRRRYRRSA
ncbi:hypothetical protein CRI94_16965 [Longibacter salinarum]|uniref:Uncharacterized protein n=1 Tax=Longibacter salinarum TaxID=1850348 RepID=A0A2A8CTP3_9BACT|nr:hypothetical protein [Longibacter salinarum]PEN11111.1 hypothetical protein CRI94_16965 [Longibacter salinarum]